MYTREELVELKTLRDSIGWKIYKEKILQKLFDKEYKKLRNSRKSAPGYSRVNGYLDGVEDSQQELQIVIENESDDNQ